jgi:DNA polymerase-1
LVDGTGVAHRAFWGSPSNIPGRFAAAVQRALPTSGADIIVCWDGKGSWRRDLFPGYKANRPAKPQALVAALEECRRLFPGYVADGFEADDLLATFALAHRYREVGLLGVVLVLSDDKDMLQLVQDRQVYVVNSSGAVFDDAAVRAKFGVPPDRIRHLLSWMGDKVDGLPGVPGYGPKRAAAKALDGHIGNELTYELAELATVPTAMLRRVGAVSLGE